MADRYLEHFFRRQPFDESKVNRDASGRFARVRKGGLSGEFDKIEGVLSIEEALLKVNPNYSDGSIDYLMNCGNTAIAYELRRRGYDVQALGNPNGMSGVQALSYFDGALDNSISGTHRDVTREINSWPDGARGMIGYIYDLPGGGQFGHMVVVEVRNGKAYILDPQSGGRANREIIDQFRSSNGAYVARIDNLSTSGDLREVVQPRQKPAVLPTVKPAIQQPATLPVVPPKPTPPQLQGLLRYPPCLQNKEIFRVIQLIEVERLLEM